MRILVDEHDYSWDDAWRITQATLSYTNHTLLPEALESWPVALLNRLLPRHMQIIYVINKLHLDEAAAKGFADPDLLASISLIQEGQDKRVRMGHLAFVGSHKINGVSALHTGLMEQTVFRDLDRAMPGRIVNMTNGISFRRWLFEANPNLTALLTGTLGERVLDDPNELTGLERFADDASFVQHYAAIKRGNKEALAKRIHELTGVDRRSRRRCSTCRSSASTNTSASFSTSWKRSRSISPSGWSRTAHGRRGSRFSPARPRPATNAPS